MGLQHRVAVDVALWAEPCVDEACKSHAMLLCAQGLGALRACVPGAADALACVVADPRVGACAATANQ